MRLCNLSNASRLAAAAVSLSLLVSCTGATPRAPLPPGETFLLKTGPALLWEVSKPGEKSVSIFLLGSLHLLDKPLSLGPKIERAFSGADGLVVELDIRDQSPEDTQELLVRYGALGWGERLADFLSRDTLTLLDTYLDDHAFSQTEIDGFHRMLPWAIALGLEGSRAQTGGLRQEYGVEQYFLDRVGHQMPVFGLETADEQFFSLSSTSRSTQEALLRQTLGATAESGGSEIVALWKAGDAEAIARLILPADAGEDAGAFDEVYETFFFARNARMADGLQELMEEKDDDVFFAIVGAGHLVGSNTVQNFLRDAGYRVTRATE